MKIENYPKKITLIDGLGHQYKINLKLLKVVLKTIGIIHLGTKLRVRLLLEELTKTKLPENARILDAGCGYGFISMILAKKGYHMTALDKDEERIKTAKIITEYNNCKVNYINGDIYHLLFKNGYFDLIICFEVLEHLANDKKAVSELFRVTKKNGYLVFSLPYPVKNEVQNHYLFHKREGYTIDDFRKILPNKNSKLKVCPYGKSFLGRLVLQFNFWLWHFSPYFGLSFFPLNYFLVVADQKLPPNGQPEGNLAIIRK